MRYDLASDINVGDTVYNCFMDTLVVTSIYRKDNTIIMSTIDTRLNRANYNYNDIYLYDLEEESDDEKSWVKWAKDNRDFLDSFDNLQTVKEVYKTGFCNGFEHKRKITFEENMQK